MSNPDSRTSEREYVLGTHDEEIDRLGLQHRAWRASAYALWDHAGFGPGHTLVDVGAGPGFGSLDLAHIVGPTGRIVAVDQSRRFLDHLDATKRALGLDWVEPIEADVQALALPAGTAHGAYCRWVMSFVPDAEKVVAGVARALRPGGVFALQEYIHYKSAHVVPPDPICATIFNAVDRSWRRGGSDPDAAGRLPALLDKYGLTVTTLRPLYRLARPGTMLWEWPTAFFRNFLPILAAQGEISAAEQDAFQLLWARRSADPYAFFLTPPMVEIVAVKRPDPGAAR